MKVPKKPKEQKVAEAAAAKRIKEGTLKKDQVEGYIRGWFRKPSSS
jgi:hypothetical protein